MNWAAGMQAQYVLTGDIVTLIEKDKATSTGWIVKGSGRRFHASEMELGVPPVKVRDEEYIEAPREYENGDY